MQECLELGERQRPAEQVALVIATSEVGQETPLVIGFAFQSTGSFFGPLVYIAVVAILGALAYSVVLGDIRRLERPS